MDGNGAPRGRLRTDSGLGMPGAWTPPSGGSPAGSPIDEVPAMELTSAAAAASVPAANLPESATMTVRHPSASSASCPSPGSRSRFRTSSSVGMPGLPYGNFMGNPAALMGQGRLPFDQNWRSMAGEAPGLDAAAAAAAAASMYAQWGIPAPAMYPQAPLGPMSAEAPDGQMVTSYLQMQQVSPLPLHQRLMGLDMAEMAMGFGRDFMTEELPAIGGGSAGYDVNGFDVQSRTTVMLRNIPEGYNRKMLMELLDAEGFRGKYDFLYLPFDFSSFLCLNHAFINFVTPADAEQVKQQLSGRKQWSVASENVCSVDWNDKQQGLSSLIERYRNSPVMHESIPDPYKPAVFQNGQRVAFPPPTKRIRAPRVRRSQEDGEDPGLDMA
mmetsp:Transcript_53700/g.125634  ORF Transcript_53700/g.125634 Transcript_53700/m.125634 type:complete len:383 (-) Transcript_53700:206-1354(-)